MSPGVADKSFDVLIIGGGNAGISAAARLIRRGVTDVGVIESQAVHTYRPLLSYVGGGQATMRDAERTQRSVTPQGCQWIRDSAVSVDPGEKRVRCDSGATYRYTDLIIACGLVPDADALPGIEAAMDTPAVASNYLNTAEKTWTLVESLRPGDHAVFTVPRAPVSCTGTTIKPLFLAAAHWKRAGNLPGVQISLVVDRDGLVGVPALDERLRRLLDALDVQLFTQTAVTSLAAEERQLTVSGADGSARTLSYDMLHLVPPFRGPEWVTSSGLAGDDGVGLVDIDPCTFRHRAHAGVWGVGDGAAIGTDPSGGALRRQVAILVDNLLAARNGGAFARYDGYTVAPIATDAHHLIAGEFDRFGALASSLPSFIDPLKPRGSAWMFDRYVLPRMYWNLILKGRV
ncbi:MAG TPA: FAD/NAD(P)-binding oxidoreductase [Mycobacterium sp.]|nr:FAD/NAD(P)-binding oxidoreductase [Mycobacterium sp.]